MRPLGAGHWPSMVPESPATGKGGPLLKSAALEFQRIILSQAAPRARARRTALVAPQHAPPAAP